MPKSDTLDKFRAACILYMEGYTKWEEVLMYRDRALAEGISRETLNKRLR